MSFDSITLNFLATPKFLLVSAATHHVFTVWSKLQVAHSCLLRPHGLYSPWSSSGQNTGVGICPFSRSSFHPRDWTWDCRWILYQLSRKGSPRLQEWVAYPFSSGSSWPRNQTRVSCFAVGFSTNWAIREALHLFVLCYDSCQCMAKSTTIL